jgi:predicted ester cyclase
MSAEQNKQIARRIIDEVFSKHNMALIDVYFDPGFVEHQFGLQPDLEGMKPHLQSLFQAFPDYRLTIEEMVADGDRVWLRLTGIGTNSGGFMGPPNGKSFKITTMEIMRLKDGRVVEHWGVADRFALMAQLGLLPARSSG